VRILVFKPDGIGDFVLAMGAIRLLAREYGEENLTLLVRSVVIPLARSQFPKAVLLELASCSKRKFVNLLAWNLVCSVPLWLKLRRTRFDAAVSLRTIRNSLETILFYSTRARRRLVCENLLGRSRKSTERAESILARLFRTETIPYPTEATIPLEMEAHRLTLERMLGRTVSAAEVTPVLHAEGTSPGTYWVCAPVTNTRSKIYPINHWAEIFRELKPIDPHTEILLAGAPEDVEKLEELNALLRGHGISNARIVLPLDLSDYVQLLVGAQLVLTVDTAAAHFATSLDRRTLVLFSGLHLGMFGPWTRSDRQRWLLPNPALVKKKVKWYMGIPPEFAARTARELLASPKVPAGNG